MEAPSTLFDPPQFSVVIPTCDRLWTLQRCLAQLALGIQTLEQTKYEVIVTDDGVRQSAETLLRREFPWAKWVAGPRRGPAANRNHGALSARGEWIVFTDDDCVPKPGWLEAYATAISPGCCVYEGKTTCEAGLHSPLEHAPINLTGGCLWSCNMMIRLALFREIGGYDEQFTFANLEDVALREVLGDDRENIFVANAIVDHPPRRLPFGAALGRLHEGYIYYHLRYKATRNVHFRLLKDILRNRLHAIARFPVTRDSLIALFSLIGEMAEVVSKVRSWQKKYARSHGIH